MKKSKTCPKCGRRNIYYIMNVADKHHDGSSYNSKAMIALTNKGKLGGYAVGELEAYVCTICGYCEQYVKNPAYLPVDGKAIIEYKR